MPNLFKISMGFSLSPLYLGLFPLFVAHNVLADNATMPATAIEVKTEPKEYINVAQPDLNSAPRTQMQNTAAAEDNSREISDEELQQQPALARKLLNYVIETHRWDLLPDLLAIYKKTQDPDLILIDYAQATLYRVQGNLTGAIDLGAVLDN
ncbi:hypothetical protein [Avibacterium paragallinarum]|uniref:Surface lipoprotein assembly modifier N-terminal TPR repeats region domain-containing protein n=1 Tax=Avibacterium paragallinarum TaxID=728 RepID=A0ABU7QT89_AVIPA|nr:hypothetical protein [Avibacterium paragallinarum]